MFNNFTRQILLEKSKEAVTVSRNICHTWKDRYAFEILVGKVKKRDLRRPSRK